MPNGLNRPSSSNGSTPSQRSTRATTSPRSTSSPASPVRPRCAPSSAPSCCIYLPEPTLSLQILFNMAVINATVGEHAAAVNLFRAATERDRYLAIAYVRSILGHAARSLIGCTDDLKSFPLQFQAGVSHFHLARFDLALRDFEEALLYLRSNLNVCDQAGHLLFPVRPDPADATTRLTRQKLRADRPRLPAACGRGQAQHRPQPPGDGQPSASRGRLTGLCSARANASS